MKYVILKKTYNNVGRGSRIFRLDLPHKGDYFMYSALEIAKYIINYSIEQENAVSNLKLQKLLYYVQAAFLVEEDKRCFKEPIIAWEYGPVVEDIYKNYKSYGRELITEQQEDTKCLVFDSKAMKIVYRKVDMIEREDRSIINNVVDAYADVKNPFILVKKTHTESPWKDTDINKEITIEKIRDYYNKERAKIYNH